MKKSLLRFLIFAIFSTFAFGEVSFLSPAPGVWGNKQMLIIENAKEGDYYYYSINGANPEKFGFAYDGPVLLDIEGDVTVKVAHFDSNGNKDYGEVQYSVVQNDGGAGGYRDFISSFSAAGFYDYIAGDEFNIPQTLSFSFEKNPQSYIPGTLLTISENSLIQKYIPCTVFDKNNNLYWRFIVKLNPSVQGVFTKRDVPFTVTDWDTITFLSDKLIYKIDSEYWGQTLEPIKIDRSVSHMISWQSIDYKAGNTVEYYVLPPKAEIKTKINEDGSYVFYADASGQTLDNLPDNSIYTLGIINHNNDLSQEMFSEIGVDVFYGDKISGEMTIGIFADSVYQSEKTVSYSIDKQPPTAPSIVPSVDNFYSRNPVEVSIDTDESSELFVAVSEPFIIKNTREIYKEDNVIFNDVNVGPFENYSENGFNILLEPIEDKVVYYKVEAYNQKGNLKSGIEKYTVVVDQSSYFYDKNSTSPLAEGTIVNPFVTFEQCVKAFENTKSATLSVKGDLYIDEKYELHTNLKILNAGNGRIIFGPKGSLELEGVGLEIIDCRIHKIPSFTVTSILPFFKVKNGNLDIKNCQIAGDFSKNGTIIEAVSSIVNIQDTIATVSADIYSSFISTVDCSLSLFNSSITCNGGTCVIISSNNGEVHISDNKLKIMGNTGRIAELFAVNAIFENNEFKGNLNKLSKSVEPIFASKKTILEDNGNSRIGF